MTADGKADPYIHGEPWDAGSSIELVYDPELIRAASENAHLIELSDSDYVLLSEEDVEKYVAEEAEKNKRSQEETNDRRRQEETN